MKRDKMIHLKVTEPERNKLNRLSRKRKKAVSVLIRKGLNKDNEGLNLEEEK